MLDITGVKDFMSAQFFVESSKWAINIYKAYLIDSTVTFDEISLFLPHPSRSGSGKSSQK